MKNKIKKYWENKIQEIADQYRVYGLLTYDEYVSQIEYAIKMKESSLMLIDNSIN